MTFYNGGIVFVTETSDVVKEAYVEATSGLVIPGAAL